MPESKETLAERIADKRPQRQRTITEVIAEREAKATPLPQGQDDHRWQGPRGPPALTRIIRKNELLKYVGLRKSQLAELITAGQFPKPVALSDTGRAIGWLESEIIAWQQERIAARDHKVVAPQPRAATSRRATAQRNQR
jgi:prophage regulatory protein